MKILIVGGCGFVGANLAMKFHGEGYDVRCVDSMVRAGTVLNLARLKTAGIKCSDTCVKSFHNSAGFTLWTPDIILNCAAQSRSMLGISHPEADFYGNVESTFYCLELAKKYSAALIHWSTNKVYSAEQVNRKNQTEQTTRYGVEEPFAVEPLQEGKHTVYGATKVASEALIDEWARLYDIPCIRNRFSCIAGPHQYGCADQGWVALWVLHHYLNNPLTYFGFQGKQVRDILHIDDLYELVRKQAHALYTAQHPVNEIYNVGGGVTHAKSLVECTEMCQQITANKVTVGYNPEARWADQRVFVSDNTLVSAAYDWTPTKCPMETLTDIHGWIVDNEQTVRDFYA